jgi:hypothetical protein
VTHHHAGIARLESAGCKVEPYKHQQIWGDLIWQSLPMPDTVLRGTLSFATPCAGLLVVALNGLAAIKLIQGEEAERRAAETGVSPNKEQEGSREGSAGPPTSTAEAAVAAMRLYREALKVIEAHQEVRESWARDG